MRFILLVACLFMLACSNVNSYTSHKIEAIPTDEFHPVVVFSKIKDLPNHTVKHHPVVRVVPKSKTRQGTGQSAILTSGQASWYCKSGVSRCTRGHPGGLYAAIRKDLLYLRGKTINVCTGSTNHCVRVTIIDCNCGVGANLIDLYSDAYRKLAPLSTGRINVRIYK